MKNLKTFLIVGLIAALEVGIAMGVAVLGVEVYYSYKENILTKKWQGLQDKANKGDAESQYIMGQIYLRTEYIPIEYDFLVRYHYRFSKIIQAKDQSKGAYWFLQAAKQGHGDAQAELAQCYKLGYGVEQDFDKCVKWLNEGCRSGSPLAQWRLGNLYCYGLSYRYNISNGKYYWLYSTVSEGGYRGLEEGDPIYYEEGSRSYLTHEGLENARWGANPVVFLEKDIKNAKYYWKLAAEQGFEEAIESLQKVYEDD